MVLRVLRICYYFIYIINIGTIIKHVIIFYLMRASFHPTIPVSMFN